MKFELGGEITNVEMIAKGSGIRDLALLVRQFGLGSWRKMKGLSQARLPNGTVAMAEIHWYEAHGIGKVKIKIKEWL